MAIFLYGTLLHQPLLDLVAGSPLETSSATLADMAVHWVQDASYPVIVDAPGASVTGLLVEPDEQARARMGFYEEAFGYLLEPVTVMTAAGPARAEIYRPPGETPALGPRFDIRVWAEKWAPLTLLAAAEVMEDFGARTPEAVGHRFPMIRIRAQARLNAAATRPLTRTHSPNNGDLRIHRKERPYAGFFAVEEYTLEHRTHRGETSPEIVRAVFNMGDAVVVLPYDPVRDRVLMIEQFRLPLHARGDTQPWIIEPVAGRIDGGETPEETARREALEEANVTLGALHAIPHHYPSPGAVGEYVYGFIAEADLPDEVGGVAGLESENEDIRSHIVPFDEAMEMVTSGEINAGPLILLLMCLARRRDRLRTG